MKIFINKHTNEVVGTLDGWGEDKLGIKVIPQGLTADDIIVEEIGLGHPQEGLARRLMSHSEKLDIEMIKFDSKDKLVKEKTDEEKQQVKDRRAKEKKAIKEHVAGPSPLEKLKTEMQAELDDIKKRLPKDNNKL